MAQSNPFTLSVVETMKKLYPLEHADTAWDNVGLLLDNLDGPKTEHRVLLANDLTASVADEAIQQNVSVVVAYHPIIFRGLKAITTQNSQQTSLLRLAQKNIAVYCPHTALDAANGGINDWLLDKAVQSAHDLGAACTLRQTLKPVSAAADPNVGYGRLATLQKSVRVYDLVRGVAQRLGGMRHVLLAPPAKFHGSGAVDSKQALVSRVAVCAGSGADILRAASTADLLLTGEMSHHDALAAVHENKWVMCVMHSNSERLFLAEKLQPQLQETLQSTWADVKILVSQNDRDPFVFWDVNESA